MIDVADPESTHAHDAYHCLLRAGVWTMAELGCTLVGLLVPRLAPAGVLRVDLDDTLFHTAPGGSSTFRPLATADTVRRTTQSQTGGPVQEFPLPGWQLEDGTAGGREDRVSLSGELFPRVGFIVTTLWRRTVGRSCGSTISAGRRNTGRTVSSSEGAAILPAPTTSPAAASGVLRPGVTNGTGRV